MTEITAEDIELYPKFRTTIHKIGSTKYKQVDWSPMLSGVFIKHESDRRYRQITEWFDKDASTLALKFILDRINN